jgi:iron(II)-dependent oxidoreductase
VAALGVVGLGLWWLLAPRLGEGVQVTIAQQEGEVARLLGAMPARSIDAVLIPAGPVMLGVAPGRLPWHPQLTPQRPVFLDAFFIMRHEVSALAYARCVQAQRCAPLPSGPDKTAGADAPRDLLPVVNVTWHQAQQYCEFVGMRLPTEAEWEKAARGLTGRLYPWGDHPDCRAANVRGDACPDAALAPANAPTLDISPYGVAHMGGNAWEWTADWFAQPLPLSEAPAPAAYDPAGPTEGPGRVIKGSDWASPPRAAAERHWNPADEFSPRGGFRCAATWSPNSQPPVSRDLWGQGPSANLRLPSVLLGGVRAHAMRHPSLQSAAASPTSRIAP